MSVYIEQKNLIAFKQIKSVCKNNVRRYEKAI